MVKEYENLELRPLNTFGINAVCKKLCRFENAADLGPLFREKGIGAGKWNVIGGGSNIIFTGDYDGVLLQASSGTVCIVSETADSVVVKADAGADWDKFVEWCVAHGFWGAENLSDIPGTVGASPVQNIGAYGVEAKDIIQSVEMFCVDNGSMLTLSAEHCGFGYRDSVFKGALKGKVVITSVRFVLSRVPSPKMGYGDLQAYVESLGGPSLSNIRKAVTGIRQSKLPDPAVNGNAGSFFKNPVVPDAIAAGLKKQYPAMPLYPSQEPGHSKLAAGWLIDQCGWKGRKEGRVGVHPKQALVLINLGGATGQDVLGLAERIQADVLAKFGIRIETEVNFF